MAAAPLPCLTQVCTLWVHNEGWAKEDVLFNAAVFAPHTVPDGRILSVVPHTDGKSTVEVHDFQHADRTAKDAPPSRAANTAAEVAAGPASEPQSAGLGHQDADWEKRGQKVFIFKAQDMASEQRAKHAALQISVSAKIAQLFGFRTSHVEISFRDVYLARGDMWRMTVSELNETSLYQGQKLLFLNTIRAVVKSIWIRGRKVPSAYFSPKTKPIFRSESARFFLYIQMSREMWDFDTEGSGEIMFNKVINGFLPELFKRWVGINAHHLVSIILFTRMEYEDSKAESPVLHRTAKATSNNPPHFRTKDFYRVVVSDMSSVEWTTILDQLKREFKVFLRDVSIGQKNLVFDQDQIAEDDRMSMGQSISGRPSSAMQGNILESISLASSRFSKDYIDRDLARTGISVVVITPGTGVFEVDERILRLTTDHLVNNGIGIDLVCLSPMPLHSVPLFKYRSQPQQGSRNSKILEDSKLSTTPRQADKMIGSYSSHTTIESPPKMTWNGLQKAVLPRSTSRQGDWSYAVPHWIDVSFWSGLAAVENELKRYRNKRARKRLSVPFARSRFVPRCRLYELQMMGFMENEMTGISIPFLYETQLAAKSHNSRRDRRMPSISDSPSDNVHQRRLNRALKTRPSHEHLKVSEKSDERHNWMDGYDKSLFEDAPAPTTERSYSVVGLQRTRSNQDPHLSPSKIGSKSTALSSQSPQSHGSSPGNTFLDQQMKQRMKDRIHEKEASVASSNLATEITKSHAGFRSNKRAVFSLLSSGIQSKDTSKSGASTRLTTEAAVRSPSQTEQSAHSPEPSEADHTKVSNQIRASLSRELSNQTITQASMGLDIPTLPISIQTSTKSPYVTADEEVAKQNNPLSARGPRENENFDLLQVVANTRSVGIKQELLSKIPSDPLEDQYPDPWLTLLNPSNPKKNNFNIASQFRRWQHVFPRQPRTSHIKWKSLTSPAALPLTSEYLPPKDFLEREYEEFPYKISHNEEDDLEEEPQSRTNLLRELISFRLSHGFQIVTPPAEILEARSVLGPSTATNSFSASQGAAEPGSVEASKRWVFSDDFSLDAGDSITLSKGNIIHELGCLPDDEIQVVRRHRKPNAITVGEQQTSIPYQAHIRTALSDEYESYSMNLKAPGEEYNWNYIDNYLSGFRETFSEALRFWRARFVLIPVDPPPNARRPLHLLGEDSDEEIRIEGIQRLTQIWQKSRFDASNEQRLQHSVDRQKDLNPLAIEYQTRDPSQAVAAGLGHSTIAFGELNELFTQPSSETGRFKTNHVEVRSLAIELQSSKGIKIRDRSWHWRLHSESFVGVDLTTWLLNNFKDIETREEAVKYGNQLMQQGLFQHVQKTHRFRDGNYFYRLAKEYHQTRPDSRTGWFGRKTDKSVPSTPILDAVRSSPITPHSTDTKEMDFLRSSGGQERKPVVSLSGVLQCDVDPRKRSYRREIINLHYDRLHNPENCYHIRIDWLNVTAKLIEDAILSWGANAEKYGLKLIEVPIAEASTIREHHPFRSPYLVTLAIPPPDVAKSQVTDPGTPVGRHRLSDPTSLKHSNGLPLPPRGRFPYHQALLRRFDFVLDIEAASNFPDEVDVRYSWGEPDYRFSQYIHKSGMLLAQITDEGRFLFLANRMAHNRSAPNAVIDNTGRPDKQEVRNTTASRGKKERDAPAPEEVPELTSPLISAVSSHATPFARHSGPGSSEKEKRMATPEDLKDHFEAFCRDGEFLRKFYDESRKSVPQTPMAISSPGPDEKIPNLILPERLAGVGNLKKRTSSDVLDEK